MSQFIQLFREQLLSSLASLSPLFVPPPHILSAAGLPLDAHYSTLVNDHSENTPVFLVLFIRGHLLVLNWSTCSPVPSTATSAPSLLPDIANHLHILAHRIHVALDKSKFFASNDISVFTMSLISKCSINPSPN